MAKETRALIVRSTVRKRSLEINNGQLKEIIEADPLTTTGEAAEELNISTILQSSGKLEGEKAS